MKVLTLTQADNRRSKIALNPAHIVHVVAGGNAEMPRTVIYISSGNSLTVLELFDDVVGQLADAL